MSPAFAWGPVLALASFTVIDGIATVQVLDLQPWRDQPLVRFYRLAGAIVAADLLAFVVALRFV